MEKLVIGSKPLKTALTVGSGVVSHNVQSGLNLAPVYHVASGAALTKVTRARKKMAALADMVREMFGQGGVLGLQGWGNFVYDGDLYNPRTRRSNGRLDLFFRPYCLCAPDARGKPHQCSLRTGLGVAVSGLPRFIVWRPWPPRDRGMSEETFDKNVEQVNEIDNIVWCVR